jgi:hypothetical protein
VEEEIEAATIHGSKSKSKPTDDRDCARGGLRRRNQRKEGTMAFSLGAEELNREVPDFEGIRVFSVKF